MSIFCAFKVTSVIKEGLEESLHLAVMPDFEGQFRRGRQIGGWESNSPAQGQII